MMKAKPTAFDTLNPQQRRAATFGTLLPEKGGVTAGPLLILAGAGTGKTNTLAHRTAHLVLNGMDPARILMLTFTRRAAQEMIRRTQNIVAEVMSDRGKAGDRSVMSRLIWAGTFHSVGNRILRLYAKHLGLDPNFTVLDRSDAADLMDVVRHELGFSGKDKAISAQGRVPRDLFLPGQHALVAEADPRGAISLVPRMGSGSDAPVPRIRRPQAEESACSDFDDLLLYWHVMMQTPALAQSLSKNFDHVLVDEYQDTSTLQGDVVHALKPDGKGVTVVGDDAQAIYSFRAAAVENILGFADRYKPKADMVVLAQNYRSTQPVLDAANALMADGPRQHRKTLLGTRQVAAEAVLRRAGRCAGTGRIHHRQDSADPRNRRLAEAPRDPVPQLPSQRRAGSRAHQEKHSFRKVRRPEIPGSGARQGHDVGAALGRQSAQ